MMSCTSLARFCCAVVCISLAGCETLSGADVHPTATVAAGIVSSNCQTVRQEFTRLKIGHGKLVPDSPVHDDEMEVCYKGRHEPTRKSCCTRKMERKFHRTAEEDLHDALRSTGSYLRNLLAVNLAHYEDHFLSLIRMARNQTDTLFSTNYAHIPYDRRHSIITTLFDDITKQVERHHMGNTGTSVSHFFDDLLPLVFQHILNDPGQLVLTPTYRKCLINSQHELRPFGDTPDKFSHRLSKSTAIVRAFLDALSTGFDTLNATENLPLEMTCTRALTRMLYCPHCDGLIRVRPCRNLCYNVARGCLASVAELDRHWNGYIASVETVAGEMKGYYNPEEVFSSVAMTISEAVMHTMETGHKYYAKVVEKCGHLRSTHTNVTLAQQPIKLQPDGATSTDGAATLEQPGKSNELSSRLSTFVRNLSSSKGFYHHLADTLCKSGRFSAQRDQQCWNGHALAPYNKTVPPIGIDRQMASNPEVRIQSRTSGVVMSLVDRLIHVKKTIDRKASSQMMQGDDWTIHRDTERGSGGGHAGWSSDDSDYGERSGSGSGDRDSDYWDGRPPYRTDGNGGRKQGEEDIYMDEGNDKTRESLPPDSGASRWQHTSMATVATLVLVSLMPAVVTLVTG